jgi:hypothetical protein
MTARIFAIILTKPYMAFVGSPVGECKLRIAWKARYA